MPGQGRQGRAGQGRTGQGSGCGGKVLHTAVGELEARSRARAIGIEFQPQMVGCAVQDQP